MLSKSLNRCRSFSMLLSMVVMAVISIGMSGCSVFAPANTTQEKIAYAYGIHTAVVSATTQALNSKAIKSTDAEHVLKVATDARTFLDAARTALAAGDMKTAEGQLALATSILTQIQVYLSTTQ